MDADSNLPTDASFSHRWNARCKLDERLVRRGQDGRTSVEQIVNERQENISEHLRSIDKASSNHETSTDIGERSMNIYETSMKIDEAPTKYR